MSDADLDKRFRAITHRLWGAEEGEQIYQWIRATRPPAFHAQLAAVMVPIWELNKVDLKTKILCAISLFCGKNMREVEFFFKMAAHHKIPREHVEEILMLVGLEAGFPAAEMGIELLKKTYDAHALQKLKKDPTKATKKKKK